MAPAGDMMMAECLLKAVGVPGNKIDFAKLPCKAEVKLMVPISFYNTIYKASLKQGKAAGSVGEQIDLTVRK